MLLARNHMGNRVQTLLPLQLTQYMQYVVLQAGPPS